MKRLPLFLISTLTLLASSFIAKPAFADEVAYWTIDELIDFAPTAEAEIEAYCVEHSGDFDCAGDYISARSAENKIYRALQVYQEQRFLITSINPSLSTLKFFYRDIDPSMPWSNNSENLVNLYIARLDKGYNIDTLAVAYAYNPNDSRIHIAYYDFAIMHEDENWFEANAEITLPIKDMALSENISNSFLVHAVYGQYGAAAYESFNFDSCLDPANGYVDGMECRLAFYANGIMGYVPQIPVAEPIAEPEEPEQLEEPGLEQPEPTDPEELVDPEPVISEVNEPEVAPDDPKEPDEPKEPGQPEEPTKEPRQSEEPEAPNAIEPNIAELDTTDSVEPESIAPEPMVAKSEEPVLSSALTPQAISESTRAVVAVAPKPEPTTSEPAVSEPAPKESDSQLSSTDETDSFTSPLGGGTVETKESREAQDFPWWVFAIVIAGTGVLIWWFLPSRKQR